jgi:hypothetical protein
MVPAARTQVNGSVNGTVMDASGLAMANANVKLTSQTTSFARVGLTGPDGTFAFNAVPPGTYMVAVQKPGFRKFERKDIELTSNEPIALQQIRLEVGTVAETVTVTEQVAALQTASGERSGVITSSEVEDLTIINRDFATLLTLMPGVVDSGSVESPGFSGGSMSFNVQGGRSTQNGVTVDGATMESSLMYTRNTYVSMDSVATVRILMSNYQAEFGRKPGASVQAVTKGGSKDFHGAVYWLKRHEMLNANNFFNNRNGIQKTPYRYTTEGFDVGGPIYLGRLSPRSSPKMYFFFLQEFLGEKRPGSLLQYNMPSAAERMGDFSSARENGSLITVKDPLNGLIPFPGNVIPIERINVSGQNILKLFPLPNLTPLQASLAGTRYNWTFQETLNVPKSTESLRYDYNLTQNTTFWGRWSRWHEADSGYAVTAGNANWGFLPATYTDNTEGLVLSVTHIFSPTIILETSADMSIFTEGSNPLTQAALTRVTKTTSGVNTPRLYPQNNPLDLVPQASFGGITSSPSISYEGNGRFPYYGADYPTTERATLTKIYGPHTAKLGYWSSWWRQQKGKYGMGQGSFSFGTDANNPNDSGHPFANALLGNFDNYTEPSARVLNDQRQTVIEWFAQDNWKVSRRLTLDLGVRFSRSTPWADPAPQEEAGFSPSQWNPAQAVSLLMPVISGGKRVAIDPRTGILYPAGAIGAVAPNSGNLFDGTIDTKTAGVPRGLRDASGIKTGPRFGFAYDPFGNGKTVFRGGFGMLVDTQEWNGSQNSIFKNPPIQLNPVLYYGSFDTLLNSANFLFPNGTMGYDPTRPLAHTMNFSFGIQRNVGFGTVVDVSYVGALGRHLIQARNLNSIPFGTDFLAKNLDPTQGKALPSSFLEPYLGYNAITYYQFDGNSSYHSLQATANRRVARRIQFGAAWTWSKAMDYVDVDTSSVSVLISPRVWNYGEAGFDRTHILKGSFVWDLPRASNIVHNGVVKAVFDDWQVSGISTLMSGAPTGVGLSFTYTVDITGSPTDTSRPVVIANPNLPKDQRTFFHAFNINAFAPPAVGTFGNASKYVFRGPGINNWDISSFKNIHLPWERMKMQFRGEFYNAFNHTQFSGVNTTAQFNQAGVQSNAAFGNYTSARNPRRIQLAVRLTF